jgi:enoyl-CoA hydratase/carnithine racemase
VSGRSRLSAIVVEYREGAVAIVTIDRPVRRNALELAAWRDLAGAGGHFCAGADNSEFARERADSAGAAAYDREVAAAYDAIRALPQPSVAAIAGSCVGGGCAVALCCDLRVMDKGAQFGIPAARLGTIYSIEESRLLLAIVGLAAAKRVLMGGELFDAGTAREIGFADEVVDGDVVEAAIAFARPILASAPLAVAGAEEILEALAGGDVEARRPRLEAVIRAALDSRDYCEGAAAFREKRPPRFIGT